MEKIPNDIYPIGESFKPAPGEIWFFGDGGRATFYIDITRASNLSYLFANQKSLSALPESIESFEGATDCTNMFQGCSSLKKFKIKLPRASNCSGMFYGCSSLTEFDSILPKLTYCNAMFRGTKLTVFNIDLPKATDATIMFGETPLHTFSSNLDSLTSGFHMFSDAKWLTSFDSSSEIIPLTNGTNMFNRCRLDCPSAKRVIQKVRSMTSATTLTMGLLAYNKTHPSSGLPCEGCLLSPTDKRRKWDFVQALNEATEKKWVVETTYYDEIGSGSIVVPSGDETEEEYIERISQL